MRDIICKVIFHPGLALGSTLLWGILEFIALQRSYRGHKCARQMSEDKCTTLTS